MKREAQLGSEAKSEAGWKHDTEAESRFIKAPHPWRTFLGFCTLMLFLSLVLTPVYGWLGWVSETDSSRLVLSLLALLIGFFSFYFYVVARVAKRVATCPACSHPMKVRYAPRKHSDIQWYDDDGIIRGKDDLAYVVDFYNEDTPYFALLRSKWFYCSGCRIYFCGNPNDHGFVGSAADLRDQERANCQAKAALKRWQRQKPKS